MKRDRIACAILIIFIVLVYWQIYSIPFLYSEVTGIASNEVVTNLESFWSRMLTLKGLASRPLSVLSFAINFSLAPGSTAALHAVNLIIHCINTALVYALAKRHFKMPIVAAAFFGLHPLGTACVSQIFGRSYSLGTLFMLIALERHLSWGGFKGYNRFTQNALMLGLFLMMIFSKQTLIFFPIVLVWYEFSKGGQNTLKVFGRYFAASVVVLTFLLIFYAIPLSLTAVVDSKVYLFSQFAHVFNLASYYLVPFQTSLIHELYFYRDPASLRPWVGLIVIGATIALCFRFRRQSWAFLLGALLISLLPTNSFLPKNEVIREWRLYPGLVFVALLTSELAFRLSCFSKRTRLLSALAFSILLGCFALTIIKQNRSYQTPLAAWSQVLRRYPYSAEAHNNIGVAYFDAKDYQQAVVFFYEATQTSARLGAANGGGCYIYPLNLSNTLKALGENDKAAEFLKESQNLYQQVGDRPLTVFFAD
jgi:hypothetical protein